MKILRCCILTAIFITLPLAVLLSSCSRGGLSLIHGAPAGSGPVTGSNTGSEGLVFTLRSDKISYSVSGIGTCKDTDIVIPRLHEELPVVEIGRNAFLNNESITSVVLHRGLLYIDDYAFMGCTSLSAVDLSAGLKEIGTGAFFECESLTEVSIPSSVERIKSAAFSGCKSLCRVTVDSAVKLSEIPAKAFYNCIKLKSVSILGENDIKYISKEAFFGCAELLEFKLEDASELISVGESAFNGCTALEYIFVDANKTPIDIPKLTEIQSSAFSGCESLKKIHLPDSLTFIMSNAFSGCTSLTELHIPKALGVISGSAFNHCVFSNVTIDSENKHFMLSGGCLLSSNYTLILGFGKEITFPEGVTVIPSGLFYGNRNIEKVTFPSTLTAIESEAFYGCSSLTSVVFPDSLTLIMQNAFAYCTSLSHIYIPKSVEYIYSGAFACAPLESIEVEKENTYFSAEGGNLIGISRNDGTKHLLYGTSASVIPSDVTVIESYAFYGRKALTKIQIPKSVNRINPYAFAQCTSLSEMTFEEGSICESIGTCAFSGSAITHLSLPSLTSITLRMLYDCPSLKEVHIPYGQAMLPSMMPLGNCPSLETVYFEGTCAQWNSLRTDSIVFPYDSPINTEQLVWYYACPNVKVICSDGTITYN